MRPDSLSNISQAAEHVNDVSVIVLTQINHSCE